MKVDEDFVFPVYIYESVLIKIFSLCKNSDNEIMGQLIGNVFSYENKKYTIIKDLLYIEGAIYSHKYSTAMIEGTLGDYETKFNEIRNNRGDADLRRVGWWHSHPDFGCFLSNIDLDTQRRRFDASHEVALVIDPIKYKFKFFTLDNDSKDGYKEVNFAVIPSLD